MNQAEFQVQTQADRGFRLARAVLIYRGASERAFATVHEIAEIDGEPVILAGKAMTTRAAIELARALSKAVAHGGFLPETVLYMDGELLLWWVPPATRQVVFKAAELGAPERGEVVPHPGLVFAASSSVWKVWAVKGGHRPTLSTALFQAPYFNVYENGNICRGSVRVPNGTTAEKIDVWNAAFFGSFFTHPNTSGKLVRYCGGAYAFWRDMLEGKFKRFPERVLIDAKITLGKLLGAEQ